MKANKVLSILLSVTMLLAVVPFGVLAEGENCLEKHHFKDGVCLGCGGILGDVDGNGKLNAKDYMMIRRSVLGMYTLDAEQLPFCDVNGNNKVEIADYCFLRAFILEILDELPANNSSIPVSVSLSLCDIAENDLHPYENANETSTTHASPIDATCHFSHVALETLILEYGVTSIGDAAFMLCENLKEVRIPASVSQMGAYVFAECRNLDKIYVYATETQDWDENWAANCNATIEYITCQEHVVKEYSSPATCTTDGYAITQCIYCGLKTANTVIPASGHTYTNSSKCDSCGINKSDEYEYTIVNNTITITDYIGNGGDVVIPSEIDGCPVTEIGNQAFDDCTSLTSVNISDGITSIGESAFKGCSSLTSIVIPDSVASIGGRAFAQCNTLTDIHCEAETQPEGWNTDWSGDCLATIWFDGVKTVWSGQYNDLEYVASHGKVAITRYVGNGSDVVIPSEIEGCLVTKIDEGAFSECHFVKSVAFPESVTSIGDYAFAWCYSLTNIHIPDGVTSIGSRAFFNCSSLTNIHIPNGVTSIGSSTFYGCSSLASITIPNSVASIGEQAFFNCSSFTSIAIPDSVNFIDKNVFGSCDALTSIVVSKDNEYYYSIENCIIEKETDKLIACCNNSAIPDGVTSIGDYAFYGNDTLINITIPDTVSSIGAHAFSWCTSLTSITIPDSITSIGDRVFERCTDLTDIYCEAESQPEDWNENWLGDCNPAVHWNTEMTPATIFGDIDGNGGTNAKDYMMLKRHILGTLDYGKVGLSAEEIDVIGDIDGDSKINAKDYFMLKRYILGTWAPDEK